MGRTCVVCVRMCSGLKMQRCIERVTRLLSLSWPPTTYIHALQSTVYIVFKVPIAALPCLIFYPPIYRYVHKDTLLILDDESDTVHLTAVYFYLRRMSCARSWLSEISQDQKMIKKTANNQTLPRIIDKLSIYTY